MRALRSGASLFIAGLLLFVLTGCPEKGPAEKAGEQIDKAKDKVSDTLDPKGPAEKAGREIDRATGND